MKINFKKSVKNSGRFFSQAGNNPYFDWGIILTVSFVVALIFIGMSVNLFLNVRTDGSVSGSGVSSAVPVGGSFDMKDLLSLIGLFNEKSSETPVFAATYPGPSDPAIPFKIAKPLVAGSAASASAAATSSSLNSSKNSSKSSAANSSAKNSGTGNSANALTSLKAATAQKTPSKVAAKPVSKSASGSVSKTPAKKP